MSEENLRQREEELRVKEQEIRLRELEMELNKVEQRQQSIQPEPPLYETVKHEGPKPKKSWLRKLPKMLKFGLMIFVTLVLVWTAASIAFQLGRILFAAIIVGGIGFMGYKLYLEGDDD
ncbi:MAG: small multi-drug export protein [Leptolyngbyaceae bacterium]|nr:small multi-drug export protein [Leptolyngbyaceae bacterium]